MKKIKYNKGGGSIIGLIVFVIIIVLILNFFNINVRKIAESPTGQTNINYVKDNTKVIAQSAWEKYIKDELKRIWDDIIVKIFIKDFVDNMTGKAMNFNNIAPSIPFNTGNTTGTDANYQIQPQQNTP